MCRNLNKARHRSNVDDNTLKDRPTHTHLHLATQLTYAVHLCCLPSPKVSNTSGLVQSSGLNASPRDQCKPARLIPKKRDVDNFRVEQSAPAMCHHTHIHTHTDNAVGHFMRFAWALALASAFRYSWLPDKWGTEVVRNDPYPGICIEQKSIAKTETCLF